MKQQTAVEWLMSSIPSLFVDDSGHYQKLFDRAKAMEKKQIENAFNSGVLDGDRKSIRKITTSEEYYEETYMDGADD